MEKLIDCSRHKLWFDWILTLIWIEGLFWTNWAFILKKGCWLEMDVECSRPARRGGGGEGGEGKRVEKVLRVSVPLTANVFLTWHRKNTAAKNKITEFKPQETHTRRVLIPFLPLWMKLFSPGILFNSTSSWWWILSEYQSSFKDGIQSLWKTCCVDIPKSSLAEFFFYLETGKLLLE